MSKATLSDIAACFRLLLGREPSAEEAAIHAKVHIGNDLADVLRQYLESDEFRARKLVKMIDNNFYEEYDARMPNLTESW